MNNIKSKVTSILEEFNNGQKQKALKEINTLLKSKGDKIDLLLIQTKMLINLKQINIAIKSLLKILNLDPKNILVLELIYTNFIKINNFDNANKYIDKLLKLGEKKYEVLRDKAFILYIKKDFKNSQYYINKALEINHNEVFGININGLLKIEQNKPKDALKLFNKAITINPKYFDSYNNIGKCYIDLEDLSKAYIYFKKAYRLNSNSDLPIINIANILSLKDKNKLAVKFLYKAKEINPSNLTIDENIAICKCRLKDLDWVEKYYNLIKTTDNPNYDIILGYSYLLLHNYEFEKGFKLFDARLKTKNFPSKNIYHQNIYKILSDQQYFNSNNEILIIKEQGVGDEILFSSLYDEAIKHYTNIKIECDERLINIFKRSFRKNIFYKYGHFSSSKKKLQNFDKVFYSGSLTKHFRKNISDFKTQSFLKTNKYIDKKIRFEINKFNKTKKIGISWKSIVNIYGSLKSLNLTDFQNIFNNDRTIINLQYGDVEKEIKEFHNMGFNIINFKEIDLFNDFDSLISILKNIDVFVTVSNSTAHFAGALGVPTILICPKKASIYYYWDYDNGKTPWYNSVSIIKLQNSITKTIDLVNKMIDSI